MSDAKEFRELFDKLFDVLTESDAKISTRINAYIALADVLIFAVEKSTSLRNVRSLIAKEIMTGTPLKEKIN